MKSIALVLLAMLSEHIYEVEDGSTRMSMLTKNIVAIWFFVSLIAAIVFIFIE